LIVIQKTSKVEVKIISLFHYTNDHHANNVVECVKKRAPQRSAGREMKGYEREAGRGRIGPIPGRLS